ncbi:hypothetical protein JCM10212_004525 [Sporobolomyces blumeae]
MGLIPRPNHLVLIRDCYPPAPSSSAAPLAPIPSPVSNGLGKLSFYAVHRPKKLPKVVHVLLERATKDRAAAAGGGGGGGGSVKARQDLGVTLDVLNGIVRELGESTGDGAGELVKAVAEDVLKAAELALSGGTAAKGKGKGRKRDYEMEAKGASLFASVAILLTPPFFGLREGFGKQYLRCMSFLSDLAQLDGPEAGQSRLIALEALRAAAASDILYQTAGDYEMQAEHLVPAIISNCHTVPVPDLRKLFHDAESESEPSRLAATLSARKPPTITASSDPPNAHDLASVAVPTLRLVARLSDSSQLISLHAAVSTFLNRHRSGELWHGNSQTFVGWLASSLLAASTVSYRPAVVGWWVDQVGEIYDAEPQHKSVTLLYVLSSLLRGKTNLYGLPVGGVLSTMAELLIRRARVANRIRSTVPSPTGPNSQRLPVPAEPIPLSSPSSSSAGLDISPSPAVDYPQDRDLLTRPILSTIASLANRFYYVDQLDDLVADLVGLISSLRGPDGAFDMNKDDKVRAATKLVVALRLLLEEAHRGTGKLEAAPGSANGKPSRGGSNGVSTMKRAEPSEITVRNGSGARDATGLDRLDLPPPIASEATLESNGIMLGAATGTSRTDSASDDVFALRSKKEASEQPTIIADDGARLDSTSQPLSGLSSPPTSGYRNRVSPRTFEKSLFLLSAGDPILRTEYVKAAVTYLTLELNLRGIEAASTPLSPDLAYLWKSLHSHAFVLATTPSLSLPPPSASTRANSTTSATDARHPLTRVRSQRSLRSASLDSTASRPPPHLQIPSSSTTMTLSGPASPTDYAAIARLLEATHRLGSASAVVEGVPMLIALERVATEWENGSEGRERSLERAHACREIVARAVTEIGRMWNIREVEEIGREVLDSLSPSVMPAFGSAATAFAARPATGPAELQQGTLVEAIAFSDALQSAAALDRTSLAALLGANWAPEVGGRARSGSLMSPYANGGVGGTSRSVLALPLGSSARVHSIAGGLPSSAAATSPPRGPGSMRTPSLADLQTSLVGSSSPPGARSARTSNAPSIASTNGERPGTTASGSLYGGSVAMEGSPSKRRTGKVSAETLLASVGRRSRINTTSTTASSVASP